MPRHLNNVGSVDCIAREYSASRGTNQLKYRLRLQIFPLQTLGLWVTNHLQEVLSWEERPSILGNM